LLLDDGGLDGEQNPSKEGAMSKSFVEFAKLLDEDDEKLKLVNKESSLSLQNNPIFLQQRSSISKTDSS
jgi:LAS superfamily LD-carboxypeptidase LdcB